MMHNRAGRKLRRSTPHRLAMFSNQLQSLMTHERIQTTLTKAKELRPLAERLITIGKSDDLAARRKVSRWIPDRTTVKKVFESLAPRFVDRPGGYTRILRLGPRQGDAAEAAILEFVDFKFEAKEKAPRKESMSDRARRASGGRVETVRKEKAEGSEGAEGAAEAAKPAKKARPARPERGARAAAKAAPKKGPSRTGHTKRGE
ncbi:MAG TPA: 50S ribosomal protein L17 [Thermoanaerobaculia bacterium]|nr:50S ribosomal protein L17 [Thermoanaerobaculia bacterium]